LHHLKRLLLLYNAVIGKNVRDCNKHKLANSMRLFVHTICLILALSLPLSAYGQSETDTTNSFNITDPSQASDPIAKLELRIFDHTYKSDSQEARLKRLENFVFGAAQAGDTPSRLSKLQESVTASNPSSSSTTAQDSGTPQKGAETASEVATKPTFDEADYPRVDQLERQILGQQHSHEILSGRLSRLEAKAFGQPSSSTDPADRVDALDAYVARHDIYGGQGNSNVGQTVPFTPYSAAAPPSNQGAPSYPAASSSAAAAYQGTPYQSPYGTGTNSPYSQAGAPPASNPYLQANITSTNDRLASMEKTEFGRDYPTHSLKERVQRLEKKVDPDKKGHEGQSLPARVDQLWAVVSVSNSIGNAPIASSASRANDNYSSSSQQANNNSIKPHHSLLHSVGKVLGAAAVTAGSAGMMMGGMGMSGMGGMGMSRYGMGGYGMSPYSMGGYNGGYGSGYSNYGGYGSGYGGYNNSYGLGRF